MRKVLVYFITHMNSDEIVVVKHCSDTGTRILIKQYSAFCSWYSEPQGTGGGMLDYDTVNRLKQKMINFEYVYLYMYLIPNLFNLISFMTMMQHIKLGRLLKLNFPFPLIKIPHTK